MAKTKKTLGAHLARLRRASGLTLSQVEKATGNEVSDPYICQLENDICKNPSPKKLVALAQVYGTSYEDLLRRAGHLPSKSKALGRHQSAHFAIQGLTRREEQALLDYLAVIRKQRRK